MLIINFDKNELCKKAYGLWQYDYGQVLRIQGLSLPTAAEIHFALQETGGEAVTRIGITKDGVTDVTIPDSLLEADGASQDYQIYVFVYLATPVSGETTRRITLGVKSRPRPEAFNTPEGEELFEEAIQAVNNAAKRAEDAGKEATAAAGEARESASLAGKYLTDTQVLAEQVEINADLVAQGTETARDLLAQTQEAASNAALSAETAKQSETAAREAQTAAETAEDAARQYAEETEADRREVAESKQSVTQMKSDISRMQADVQANREAVEQTVTEFRTAAQGALTAIGQAQNTAVSAVQTEGQRQTTAVQQAGTQAVSEVTEAKTTAVEAVTTEGDTQTKRVEDAAAGIIADREQISQNKTDIAGLVEGMTDLAPAIHSTASGSVITANDATEGRPFRGLRVFGKSTQDGTPTPEAPIPIVSAGEDGSIEVKVTGKNLLTGRLYYIDYSMGAGFIKNENEVSLPYAPKSETSGIGYVIPCAPEKHYAFSVTNPNENAVVAISEYKTLEDAKNKENAIGFVVPSSASPYKSVYTSKGNGVLVCWIAGKWTDGKTTIHECTESELLQLEIGSEATTYEPPRIPQSLTLQTPNGLPGVPVSKDGNYTDQNGQQWVCDEIDLTKKKYVQRVLKTKPNKTIVFSNRDENGRCAMFDNSLFGTKWMNGAKQALSSIAQWSEWGNGVDGTFALSANGLYYKDPTKTLEEMNAMFAKIGTDFEVCGVLATPIKRDLTPEEIAAYEALHTNYPTTVITNDAGAHMEASYVADTGTYIRNMESRLNAKLVNIQSALISQKISGGGYKGN